MKVFCKYCVKTKSGILSKTFKTVKLTILLCKLFVRISEFTVAIYRYFLNDPFTLSLKKSITLYVDIVLICILFGWSEDKEVYDQYSNAYCYKNTNLANRHS